MADQHFPAGGESDSSEDENPGRFNFNFAGNMLFDMAMNHDVSDDDFLIDDWADDTEEEFWTSYPSDDSDDDVMFTDGRAVKKIYVTNFQPECTPKDFETLFSKFGEVTAVSILDNNNFRGGKRYAFVTFATPEQACLALRASPRELHLRWKKLKVFPAHSWHQPTETPEKTWKRDTSEVIGACEINKLNDDCLFLIFGLLPISEQMKIERVCKRWQELSRSMWLRRTEFDLMCLSGKNGCFSVPAFRKVIRYCGQNLTSLDFCNVKSDSISAVLPLISHNCCNLEVLKLSEVPMNRCYLMNLGSNCPNLRHITFISCHGLKDYELGRMLRRLEKLEYVDLSKNTYIDGYFLRHLKPSVRSLVLDECNNLKMQNLLQEVSKPSWGVTMLSLNSCQTLTTLDVQKLCAATAGTLRDFRLNSYFPRLGFNSLKALGSLQELTSLCLEFNSSVNKEVILSVCKGCQKLEELNISGCVEHGRALELNGAIETVARLPKLQYLKTNYMLISDDELCSLAKYAKKLKILECRGCPSITKKGVAAVLSHCDRLEQFDLSGCYLIEANVITEAVVATATRKDKIKLTLYLGGTQVVKSDLDSIDSSLLEINTADRSYRHLRPDFDDDIYFGEVDFPVDDYDFYESDDDLNPDGLNFLLNVLAM